MISHSDLASTLDGSPAAHGDRDHRTAGRRDVDFRKEVVAARAHRPEHPEEAVGRDEDERAEGDYERWRVPSRWWTLRLEVDGVGSSHEALPLELHAKAIPMPRQSD